MTYDDMKEIARRVATILGLPAEHVQYDSYDERIWIDECHLEGSISMGQLQALASHTGIRGVRPSYSKTGGLAIDLLYQ